MTVVRRTSQLELHDSSVHLSSVQEQLAALHGALALSQDKYYKLRETAATREQQAEAFTYHCRQILEQVVRNQPLPEILANIGAIVERHVADSPCTVFLLREGKMSGNAASGNQVEATWQELAETYWTVPITDGAGNLIGALGIDNTVRPEDEYREKLLETLGRLAAVAIEHDQLYAQLNWQATCDRLTGLPNRTAFEAKLSSRLTEIEQGNLALLWMDLDRFKEINDTLGHWTGDMMLQEVAQRFRSVLPESAYMARTGGDEFAVILENFDSQAEVEDCARRLLQSLEQPLTAASYDLFVTASIGISLYPVDARDAGTLQQNADTAMYRAKSRGKNQFSIFEQVRGTTALERLELENGLRKAIAGGELELYYQPQVDLDGAIKGMEALVRWNHPVKGLLLPAHFIPLAEETGLIMPLGAWAMREACQQAATWHRSGFLRIKVAVNVSVVQFYFDDVVAMTRTALQESTLAPECLEVELTESLVMRDSEEALRQIRELRNLGVSVAIDDFGTGYSSLSYLHKLPVDLLKIDRSFLEHSESRSRSAFVQAITMLAHSLGLQVVAEGIEDTEQMADLRLAGVDFAQGFLIGRPMPKGAAGQLLQNLSGSLE